MSRKISDDVIINAANLVVNGIMTAKDAAKSIPMNPSVFSKRTNDLGFSFSRSRKGVRFERIDLPVKDIISMYENGKSENAIAKHFKVSRNAIRHRLLDAGIKPRTQSEAESLKWSQMSDEARANQVKNANDSVRGKTVSIKTRKTIAKAREKLQWDHLIGIGEIELAELFKDAGFDIVRQKAIYTYNVDIAIGNIAVELTSSRGRYTMFNPKEIKRAKNLLKCGYHVLAIDFDDIDSLINSFNYIVSTRDQMSRLKPVDGEYWVVSCRRNTLSVIRDNSGKFTRVVTPEKFTQKTSVVYF